MKILAGTTCLVFLFLSSCTTKVSDRFIDDHKDLNRVYTVSIPGCLVTGSLNQIEDFTREDDQEVYKELIGYLDGIRFMLANGPTKVIDKKSIDRLSKELVSKDGMQSYASIKHKDGLFNVWVLEKDDQVKNITIVIDQNEVFGIARINCHIPLQLFKSSNFSFN